VANLRQFEPDALFGVDDTVVCVLPLFHIYGMTVLMNAGISVGATLVMLPRFDLQQFLQVVQDYRVTFVPVVPPIMLAFAKHPAIDGYDLSSVRTLFSGAAPLGAEVSRACVDRLGVQVRQGYGLTETSPGTHTSPSDPRKVKLGAIGRCIASTECRVVDLESGRDCGPGEAGELWIRGPQVMKGYLNNDEATAETIVEDGWLRTGDIGYADADGQFFIVDRAKELIKYKGCQVAPAELEALLLSHPAVADAAVIPSPDEEAGEIPKAFVVPRGEARTEEIMAYVAGHVAPFKKIRAMEFVDQIPKSPSGKILRRVLVERERAKRAEGRHAG
jgi:acyl-CoA synthetase (AMP-forming)/AMP-acid ligase II